MLVIIKSFFCCLLHKFVILLYPLAELSQRILDSANGLVVFVVNVLYDCKCADFPDNPGEQPIRVFRIIAYEHKLVT